MKVPARMTAANSEVMQVNESPAIALNGLERSGLLSAVSVKKSSGFQTSLPLL